MTSICKYCKKVIFWDTVKKAYFEENGLQHKCEGYYQARKLKDAITARDTNDLLLQILNEVMAIRTIISEKNRSS